MDWNAKEYRSDFSYVWERAQDLLRLLDPKAGERILDLGCGTGELTAAIAKSGATIIGLDASKTMIEQARERFSDLTFMHADARNFTLETSVDAVFSNAALHWIRPPETAALCAYRALKPGGRFVGELGGAGNVATIDTAISAGLSAIRGRPLERVWYFPSVAAYASVLEGAGFEVSLMSLFDRPTPLAGGDHGLRGWIEMFAKELVEKIDPAKREIFFAAAEDSARQTLYRSGTWSADYRRLRFIAYRRAN